MTSFNVGIIGFGFMGKVHAYGYLNLPLFYEPFCQARITHVCTSRPETAHRGAALVGADVATTDFREITENPDVQIVHVCTPNHLHKDPLLSAIAHNKHIYCDKPLTATLAEARDVEAALTGYTATAQMTLQTRFFPATLRAKQLVDEGSLGEPLQFRAGFLHSSNADPNVPLKWKLDRRVGGGVIADLASHVLDFIHHLLGDYEGLSAVTKIAYPERPSPADPSRMLPVEAEDCVTLIARMKNGAVGTLEATKLATGTENECRIEVHGTDGALRFNTMAPHFLEVFDRTAPTEPMGGMAGWTRLHTGQRYPAPALVFPSPKNYIGWIRSHMACLANFLHDVVRGRPGDPGLRQGVYIQHLMDCCRRSAEAGSWVTV